MEVENVFYCNNPARLEEALTTYHNGVLSNYYKEYPLSDVIVWDKLTKQDLFAISNRYYEMSMKGIKR